MDKPTRPELILHSQPEFEFVAEELKMSWKYAVRAYNIAQNSELKDTASMIKKIIIKLSQELEFCESMSEDIKSGEIPYKVYEYEVGDCWKNRAF